MMTEFSQVENLQQILTFLYAVLLGGGLCLCYDFLRLRRMTGHVSVIRVFLQDLFFSILSAIVVFCFLLIRCQGIIRVYVFAGMIPGFILVRCTVSRLFLRLSIEIVTVFCKVMRTLFSPFNIIANIVTSKVRRLISTLFCKIKNIFKTKKKTLENDSTVDV